jgi:phosphoenolpyruvate carboxylase
MFFGSGTGAGHAHALYRTAAETDPYAPTDPFYRRTDLSLDFYRAIRRVQQQHLSSSTYSRALTAFGLGLLNDTGSRKSRRQSDVSSDRTMSCASARSRIMRYCNSWAIR